MSGRTSTSQSLIASLFPEDVITEELWETNTAGSLHPEEEPLSLSMSASRRLEFTNGRCCARKALSRIGLHSVPILMQPDRAPIWPTGVVGSISHTEGYVGVAVAQCDRIRGLGFDAEMLRTTLPDVWRIICLEEELSWLRLFDDQTRLQYSCLIFSAKECIYKCWYWATRQRLGFHDVRVVVDGSRQQFNAEFVTDQDNRSARGASLTGNYQIHRGRVFTGMALRPGDLSHIEVRH